MPAVDQGALGFLTGIPGLFARIVSQVQHSDHRPDQAIERVLVGIHRNISQADRLWIAWFGTKAAKSCVCQS